MRICLLSDSFPACTDGTAAAVLRYASILHEKYGEVLVAAPRYPGAEERYPFRVLRLPGPRPSAKRFGARTGDPFPRRILEELVRFRPDLIHAHSPFASAWLARELRELTGAPVILTCHAGSVKKPRRGILREAAARAMLANVDACDEVWCADAETGERLKKLGYRGEYRVMPDGVEIGPSPAPEEDPAAPDAGEEPALSWEDCVDRAFVRYGEILSSPRPKRASGADPVRLPVGLFRAREAGARLAGKLVSRIKK